MKCISLLSFDAMRSKYLLKLETVLEYGVGMFSNNQEPHIFLQHNSTDTSLTYSLKNNWDLSHVL